jgi:hypothetical protein
MRQHYRDDIDDDLDDLGDDLDGGSADGDEGFDDGPSLGDTAESDDTVQLGAQLEPVRPTTAAHRRASAVILHRTDHAAARMVPFAATAGTTAAGLTAFGAVEAAAAAGQPVLAGALTVSAWITTGVGLPALRFRFRDRERADGCILERIPRSHRRRWWAAGGLHALWIDAMAAGAVDAIGPWGMGAALLGGTALLSLRWMREHPVELPTDTPLPAIAPPPPAAAIEPPDPVKFPTPPPPDEGQILAEQWAAEVAGGTDPIVPGSSLGDDREDLPNGYRWVVQLDRFKGVSATQLSGLVEPIALRMGLPKTHIGVAPLPDGQAREDRAQLTIITRDALREGVDYQGPRYNADGSIPFGLFNDGSGIPHWRARTNTGPLHGMVTGRSGSGKSKLLSLLGMAYKNSGEWVVIHADGDEKGRSAPLLKRIAYDFAAGAEQVLKQLEAIEAWFHAAGTTLGEVTTGPDGLPVPITDPDRQDVADMLMPCPRYPGWVWIIDEFHRLVTTLGQKFVKRLERLVRIIRKVGGAIIIGTQSAEVGDFGGSDVLRAECRAGNVVIMASKNANDQYAVGDFGCDPTTLPGGGGYGFTDDPDGDKQQLRTEYSEHMARWVSTLPDYQPEPFQAMVYAEKKPPVPADPKVDYEENQRRKAVAIAAIQGKQRLPWEDQPEQPDPGPGAAPTPPIAAMGGDGVAAPAPRAPAGPSSWSAGGVPMAEALLGPMFTSAAARPAADVSTEPATKSAGVPAMTADAEQVLAMLQSRPGTWKTGELASALKMPKPRVSTALGVLVARSEAWKPTGLNGSYAAVQPAAEGAAERAADDVERRGIHIESVLQLLGAQTGQGEALVAAYWAGELDPEIVKIAEQLIAGAS